MDTAPCGFVAIADDGTMVEVNRTLLELLGHKQIDLLGWHVDRILPPGGRIFYQTYLFPMLKVEGAVEEIYLALRTKDGEDVPVLLNGVRRERNGRFITDCVVVRMIQRHAYEEQLLEARKLAEESNMAKAKFLSMVSHDLRTPLTAIDGNAQLLVTGVDGPLSDRQLESVQAIRDACQMQLAMVNDILEFARLDSGRVKVRARAVRVSEAARRAETLVRVQMADAGLSFSTDGCQGETAVMADPDRLQQILLNLLTNAIKFTPPGGSVSLTCDGDVDRVHINVRDTGIGIPHDHLQRIFSPFVQLDEATFTSPVATRGVGLGLAISRDLARAMRGDVVATSEPGIGSVFTIELPAAPSEVPSGSAAS